MAINIPSSHIIQKDTSIINENAISEVQCVIQSVEKKTVVGSDVFNTYFDSTSIDLSDVNQSFNQLQGSSESIPYGLDPSYLDFKYAYMDNVIDGKRHLEPAVSYCKPFYKNITVNVPKKDYEKYINNLDMIDPLKVSITYSKTSGFVWYQTEKKGTGSNGIDIYDLRGIVSWSNNGNETVYSLPKLESIGYTEQSGTGVQSSVILNDETNYSVEYITNDECYRVTAKVICGLIIVPSGSYFTGVSNNVNSIKFNGFIHTYILQRLDLSLYGDKITLTINKSNYALASSSVTNPNTLSLPETEILQQESDAYSITNNVLKNYGNYGVGLEYAEMLCVIKNYYSERANDICVDSDEPQNLGSSFVKYKISNDKLTITSLASISKPLTIHGIANVNLDGVPSPEVFTATIPKNEQSITIKFNGQISSVTIRTVRFYPSFTFSIGDYVRPYVCKMRLNTTTNAYEKYDAPLSVYSDGTAKVFEVVGINFEYGGVARQRLKLLEIPQDFLAQTIDT